MDDRRQRLVLDSTIPDRTQYFGWEVANADALDALATRLEGAGVLVQREPAALADQRFVTGLISFHASVLPLNLVGYGPVNAIGAPQWRYCAETQYRIALTQFL
jgi:hypothetical protein